MTALGEYIQRIRQERGLSQDSLYGISHAQVSAIERGTRKPSSEMLRIIARNLNIPLERLYLMAALDRKATAPVWQHMNKLEETGQWDELYRVARDILQSRYRHLTPVFAAQMETLASKAAGHLTGQTAVALELGPFATPEEGFYRMMALRLAGIPDAAMYQYCDYLQSVIAEEHVVYGKVLNNGMVAAEHTGNWPEAIQWARRSLAWSERYGTARRAREARGGLYRYLTWFGEYGSMDYQVLQQQCQNVVCARENPYVWEDYFLSALWKAWINQDASMTRILLQDSVKYHDPKWHDIPPWRGLFQAGWEKRDTGQDAPLNQLVDAWMQSGWGNWNDDSAIDFLQLLTAIGIGCQHHQAQLWWQWLMGALRFTRRLYWLQYWHVIGQALWQNNQRQLLAEAETPVPAWMIKMMASWVPFDPKDTRVYQNQR